MTVDKSWQLGDPGSLPYRVFDWLRQGLNHKLTRYLIEHTSASTILEAGSGPGSASSLLGRMNGVRRSVALDYDIEALKEAKQRDPGLLVVVGDMRALPFKANSFDLVWNSSTLEHLPSPDPALQEMQRVSCKFVYTGVPFFWGPLGFQHWIPNTGVGIWIGTVFGQQQLYALLQKHRLTPQRHFLYFFRFFIGVLSRKSE